MIKIFKLLPFIALPMTGLMAFVSVPLVYAEPTDFSQKILPLNCIFTVENTGTGELKYITPQACGQALPSPSSQAGNPHGHSPAFQEPSSSYLSTQPDTSASQPGLITPSANEPNPDSYIYGLPHWTPIANTVSATKATIQTTQNNAHSITGNTVAVVAVGSSVFLLFIFAFLFI